MLGEQEWGQGANTEAPLETERLLQYRLKDISSKTLP